MISKFLQATIARNAPLLEPEQVAAIKGMSVEALDRWANANNDTTEHADFCVDLRHWNRDMESYICVKDIKTISPCVREYLHDNLCIEARKTPVGSRLALPQKEREPYRSVAEAMDAFFPRKSG